MIYSIIIAGLSVIPVINYIIINIASLVYSYCFSSLIAIFSSRLYHLIPQVYTLPRYYLPVQVLYFGGTAVCNFLGVHTVPQAGSRAARLAMSNLVPALYSISCGFGSQLFGISLRSYASMHHTISIMMLIQSLVHAVITIHASGASLTEGLQLHGLLVSQHLIIN